MPVRARTARIRPWKLALNFKIQTKEASEVLQRPSEAFRGLTARQLAADILEGGGMQAFLCVLAETHFTKGKTHFIKGKTHSTTGKTHFTREILFPETKKCTFLLVLIELLSEGTPEVQ